MWGAQRAIRYAAETPHIPVFPERRSAPQLRGQRRQEFIGCLSNISIRFSCISVTLLTILYNKSRKIASFLLYFLIYKLTASWYNIHWFILPISGRNTKLR
jgi:hypothetical protein